MSRNDGRPKSVVELKLDPLPFVDKEDGPGKWIRQTRSDPWTEFEPREGFIQDRDAYGY